MNSFLSFKALAAGLALSASALAQAPPSLPPQAPAVAGMPMTTTGQPVTQSSRVRGFNPGPDGQIESLYLSNGSVVNLSPDLGREVGAAIAKGERITVSGLRSRVNGQTLVAANSVTLHGQTFVAQPGRPAVAGLDTPPPPPPPDGPGPGPGREPGSRPGRGLGQDMARLGPQGPAANVLPPNAPPPPPGLRPPRPGANALAAPPPPPDGGQPAAQLSPTKPNPPAQPGTPMAPPPTQPGAPSAQPTPN